MKQPFSSSTSRQGKEKYIYVRVSSEQLSRSPGTGRQFISCQIFAVAGQIFGADLPSKETWLLGFGSFSPHLSGGV
jgi:hypothetical protein